MKNICQPNTRIEDCSATTVLGKEDHVFEGAQVEGSWSRTAFEPKQGSLATVDGSHAGPQELSLDVPAASHALTRQLGASSPGLFCSECGSIIYSRRHKLCSVCGHKLPAELLFSKEEAQRLECLMRSEQRRHRAWMSKTFRQALAPSFLPFSLR
jgi:predicted nucleic acid-binding Zn ribbon protein